MTGPGWPDPAAWTPWRIEHGAEPVVEWCHTEGLAFDDPFFDETLTRAFRHPFRVLFQHRTALVDIARDAARVPSLPLRGLVLHMSRCGSTLVARMLGALPSTLVLSEPGPVASVLRLAADPSVPRIGVEQVRGVVAALARRRAPEQEACVIKLDAWSALDLPVLRRAFPDVPWVFCHREPRAVLASQRAHRGFHVIPGALPAEVLGWDPEREPAAGPDDHAARVLARVCRAALDHAGPEVRFVDHADLPAAVEAVVAPHLGLAVGDGERAALAAVARLDAKNPAVPFAGPAPISEDAALDAAVARWLRPVADELAARSARP